MLTYIIVVVVYLWVHHILGILLSGKWITFRDCLGSFFTTGFLVDWYTYWD